jgi:signal transduction histidine kinase
MLIVWLAVDYLAADYFAALMERYHISPADSHAIFLDAIHRYLVQAGLFALVLATVLSLLLTRQVLRPLARMAEVTRRVAAGDLSARVETRSRDEVGRLAASFNQMTDSLERIETLRRSMVVDMAHELRTPLTNIRGYLEALADGVVVPSKATFDMLQDEILRLVRLVENLHQLTKADAARAHLRRETLRLSDLVSRALTVQRHHFESRGISVATRFGADAEQVTGDRDKLGQVLRNLIENAWQYGSRGGRFVITTERAAEGVTMTFANTGPAIPVADLPLIFERFHRAEKSRSRAGGGAGIGLAVVKELVEAHGGRVGAASEGGINRFWLTLPVTRT